VSDEGKSLLNVVLRLDKDLKVQDMVDVMQVGANLGIKMVLATDKTSK
jgi:biopolymer transport protein ExbD